PSGPPARKDPQRLVRIGARDPEAGPTYDQEPPAITGSVPTRLSLVGRDDVDFYARVFGQARHLHGGSRGVGLREILSVNLVDRAEVVHVGEKDRGADDVGERAIGGFEQRADVVEDAARLLGDAALDHLSRRGIERHLT